MAGRQPINHFKMKQQILLIEDERDLGNVIRQYLEMFDFAVTWCVDGKKALEQITNQETVFDILLIDVSMPKLNGFELTEKILDMGLRIPFLFLTARNEKSDRLRGLKLGADDYIVKPFDIDELILRIQNIIRRSKHTPAETSPPIVDQPILNKGDVRFIRASQSLTIGANPTITLTFRESELLYFLFINENRVLKREDILSQLWGGNDYFMGRSLDVFISRLRKHLAVSRQVIINNVYGIGFVLNVLDQPE